MKRLRVGSSLRRRVLVALQTVVALTSATLSLLVYQYATRQATHQLVSEYQNKAHILGASISYLDSQSQLTMMNALLTWQAMEKNSKALSTPDLALLAKKLSVSHFLRTNDKGEFIQSTSEDPKTMPSVFRFCPTYTGLFSGTTAFEPTPIVPAHHKGGPHKFLYLPNANKTQLNEAALQVDEVASLLTKALEADQNMLEIGLYAPTGALLYTRQKTPNPATVSSIIPPSELPAHSISDDTIEVYVRAESSQTDCCQCNVLGLSRAGEYYYLLKTVVSTGPIHELQGHIARGAALLTLTMILLAFALAYFVARRTTSSLTELLDRVRGLKTSEVLPSEIPIFSNDETAEVTQQLNEFLGIIKHQSKVAIDNENYLARLRLATEISHNLKSPLLTLGMMTPLIRKSNSEAGDVIENTTKDIETLIQRLDALKTDLPGDFNIGPVDLHSLLTAVVTEKRYAFPQADIQITPEHMPKEQQIASVVVDPVEMRAVFSNLINNAVEASVTTNPRVEITFAPGIRKLRIVLFNRGEPIPTEAIRALRAGIPSSTKAKGSGIGLRHARRLITTLQGKLRLRSQPSGTTVMIVLPLPTPRS